MNMRHIVLLVALSILIVVLTACGSAATATPTVKPTPAESPTTVPPTLPPVPTLPPPPTAVPTATPVPPTPTATPIPVKATAKQLVNLRQGPGTNFSIAGQMPSKATATILGKNEDGKWLEVAYPDASHPAWVSAAFVTVTGSIDTLQVIAVPVPPTSTPGASTPTKPAVTVTATMQAFPAAKGVLSFVSKDSGRNIFTLYNLVINPRNISSFKDLGSWPFDPVQFTNASPFAWSPDGSWVALVTGTSGLINKLTVNQYAGNFDSFKDIDSHGGVSSPTFSPDSKTIAYVALDNPTSNGGFAGQIILTMSPDGKSGWSFPPRGNESFRGLAWGKTWIAFASNLTGAHEIWRLNSDGSGPMQLTTDNRENGSPAWSPDGKTLAYYSKQADGSYQIMLMNADGSDKRKLTNTANNWSPTWSPDGNWIAFTSSRGGRLDVYIMDKNGNNVQPLTDKFPAESQLPGSWR